MGRNGKLRPKYAQVGDDQVLYPEGHYELRHYERRKAVWTNVGDDAACALAAKEQAVKRFRVADAADDAGIEIVDGPSRVNLRQRAKAYLDRQIARNKISYSTTFRAAMEEFIPCAGVDFADQLTEEVILRWYAALRKNGNSNRTIHNKHVAVFGFLNWCGVNTKPLAERTPSFTEKDVEVYEPDELNK
jgi:hypothetical protein